MRARPRHARAFAGAAMKKCSGEYLLDQTDPAMPRPSKASRVRARLVAAAPLRHAVQFGLIMFRGQASQLSYWLPKASSLSAYPYEVCCVELRYVKTGHSNASIRSAAGSPISRPNAQRSSRPARGKDPSSPLGLAAS